ncbi:MAG TPA: DNA polymerase III subunit alpha, partial [Alphaproteobacteria bacterium]|nr:DNA polymerase III subunit alpha [Alphaproteobacteria bacterium]
MSEGAIKIPELAGLCAREQMPAVAITDTGNLFGVLEFSTACAEEGVQPIVGCQIALTNSDTSSNGGPSAPDQLVLLVQDEDGYSNILKLISAAFLDSERGQVPQIDIDTLAERNSGLIALTGGAMGPVGRRLANGQTEAAETSLLELQEVFQDRLYVELMRHQLEVEDDIEPGLLDLADRHNLPLVATNEVFFADQSMFDAHDALLCIADGVTVGQIERRHSTPSHYFKSAKEMWSIFEDVPEAITNTLVIAQRCSFMVETHAPMLPTAGNLLAGRTEPDMLRDLSNEGLARRISRDSFSDSEVVRYRERLAYELDVIIEMGFSGYFLIVSEFIGWAKSSGIPVGPGRGSGAGSIVSWALEITDLDPLRFGLLFERFLNPGRVSMPDFDIDFCQDRRDEVIRHVQAQYGTMQVAQIITFGKLQARAVLRDVGRVLSMPYGQIDRLCKLVPNNPAAPVTLQQAIDREPRLKEARHKEPGVDQLINVALRLEGLYRHASTHAAGVVIGDRPLDEVVPLYRDPRSSMMVTQFNMKDVESVGLVKFDFLGLKTLTVMDRAIKLVKTSGVEIDLAGIPLSDERTYCLLTAGATVGVF